MAAGKQISVDATVAAADLSELVGFLTLKEEQRTALMAFLGGQQVFAVTHG